MSTSALNDLLIVIFQGGIAAFVVVIILIEITERISGKKKDKSILIQEIEKQEYTVEETQKLFGLSMHEIKTFETKDKKQNFKIMRVAQGWIYSLDNGACFVPYSVGGTASGDNFAEHKKILNIYKKQLKKTK